MLRLASPVVSLALLGCAAAEPPAPRAAAPVEVSLAPQPSEASLEALATELIEPVAAPAPPPEDAALYAEPAASPPRDKRAAEIARELAELDVATLQRLPSSAGGWGVAGGSLHDVAGPGAGGSLTSAGVTQASGPKGNAILGDGTAPGVANASAVVAGMRAGFRRCYERTLKTDPTVTGKAVVQATVGPNGEVTGVTAQKTSLPAELMACVQARVASAQFAPPDKAPATVTIPVIFQPVP